MHTRDLFDTIDLPKRDFSLVLVNPKVKFLELLNVHAKLNKLGQYRLYVPEENTVLVIPNIDRFSVPGQLEQFLNEMKPKLLAAELSRFYKLTPEIFGQPITKETFDENFDITLRDAASLRFISDFHNI